MNRRRSSALDNGDIDIVERRSTDGGCSWSAQRVVAGDGTATVDNPVPLVAANGTLVEGYHLIRYVRRTPGVLEFQLIQEAVGRLRLLLMTRPDFDAASLARARSP